MTVVVDELDKQILEELQRNSKVKITELAEKLGRPRSTVNLRLERLEREGVIAGYRAIVNPRSFGFNVVAYVLISVKRIGPVEDKSSQIVLIERILRESDERSDLPWIEEAHVITGAYDIILKVWAKDLKQLSRFLINYLASQPEIVKTETMIVLEDVCSSRDRVFPTSKV